MCLCLCLPRYCSRNRHPRCPEVHSNEEGTFGMALTMQPAFPPPTPILFFQPRVLKTTPASLPKFIYSNRKRSIGIENKLPPGVRHECSRRMCNRAIGNNFKSPLIQSISSIICHSKPYPATQLGRQEQIQYLRLRDFADLGCEGSFSKITLHETFHNPSVVRSAIHSATFLTA